MPGDTQDGITSVILSTRITLDGSLLSSFCTCRQSSDDVTGPKVATADSNGPRPDNWER